MSDSPSVPPPSEPAEPETGAAQQAAREAEDARLAERVSVVPPSRPRRRDGFSLLILLVAAVMAGAAYWLASHRPPPPALASNAARIEALDARVRAQVAGIEQRLDALEARPVAGAAPPAVGTGAASAPPAPPPADLKPLEARIAALERRPAPPPPPDDRAVRAELASLAGQLDAVSRKLVGDEAALQARAEATDGRVSRLDSRVGKAEAEAGQVGELAARTERAGRVAALSAALDAGQPLGDIPGAPPALARFAAAPPPTEASLRLEFPEAAAAAAQLSRPDGAGQPFWDRVWARAQSIVTVRRGDRVVLGDPAAGVLARARSRLDAGDLAGAVDALGALTGPAAEAMSDWVARARALLDARAALAAMARS